MLPILVIFILQNVWCNVWFCVRIISILLDYVSQVEHPDALWPRIKKTGICNRVVRIIFIKFGRVRDSSTYRNHLRISSHIAAVQITSNTWLGILYQVCSGE